MPKIMVHKAFNLLLTPSERMSFTPGVHEVSDDVALHWYVADHSEILADDGAPTEQPVADAPVESAEAEEVPADEFDAKSDEDLRAFIKDRDGRLPHPATAREKLLKAARGDAEASEDIEADPAADAQ